MVHHFECYNKFIGSYKFLFYLFALSEISRENFKCKFLELANKDRINYAFKIT